MFIFAKDSLRPAYPRILIASRWPEGLKTSLVMKYSMISGSKDESRDRKSSVMNRDNPCEEYITVMNPDNPCEEYITVANRDIAPRILLHLIMQRPSRLILFPLPTHKKNQLYEQISLFCPAVIISCGLVSSRCQYRRTLSSYKQQEYQGRGDQPPHCLYQHIGVGYLERG